MINIIKKDEPINTYHASEPISRSKLMWLDKTPQYFKWRLTAEEKETDALQLGKAFHKLALEEKDFDLEFAVEPKVNKRTNEGKEILANFYFENAGKTIISPNIYLLAQDMVTALRANARARQLIESGEIEKSYYWTDSLTEEQVKCRPDIVITKKTKGAVIDLKSCLHADNETFRRDALTHGYDVQAYMCKSALEKITGIPHDFYFLCVEKEPPYLINVFKADELFLEHGKRRYREFLGLYHDCKITDNWFGYEGFADEINELNLPAYLLKEFQ